MSSAMSAGMTQLLAIHLEPQKHRFLPSANHRIPRLGEVHGDACLAYGCPDLQISAISVRSAFFEHVLPRHFCNIDVR